MPVYLLTGASGFLGYHLVRQLVEDGASVSIFDLNPPGSTRTCHPLSQSVIIPVSMSVEVHVRGVRRGHLAPPCDRAPVC